MLTASNDLTVWQALGQFMGCALLAVFAENVVFTRAMGVSRLLKLASDRDVRTWQFCLPVIAVQLLSAPPAWLVRTAVLPRLAAVLPAWLPVQAFRPLLYLLCAFVALAVVRLVLALLPRAKAAPYRALLPLATVNCCVLGTLLICANQNYTLLQTVGFSLGSGVGYLFAVLIVEEGRRRLRSKNVPTIFQGLPSSLIYMGILSLALYGLLGHTVAI